MFVIFLVSILALFLTFLDSKRILKNGLLYAFILITFFACIRYEYGNDYISYRRIFETANQYPILYIIENHDQLQYTDSTFKDLGSVIIYQFFHPFGFIFFAACVSIITNFIYYQFIKENLHRSLYWLGFFIYIFQFDFYLLPMSMIRQGLSMALCVWSIHFLRRKRYFKTVLIFILAFFLHKSSIVFLPFLFIAKYAKVLFSRRYKTMFYITIAATLIMFSGTFVLKIIFESLLNIEFLKIYFDSYGNEEGGGLGFARIFLTFFPFFISLFYIYHKHQNPLLSYIVFMSMIGVILFPLTNIVALISRICYYFNIFQIIAIPTVISSFKNHKFLQIGCWSLIMFFLLYQYYYMFTNSVYTRAFLEYKSIFSLLDYGTI